jgi:Zn-dependent peptidase ImmA (M78 family)/transcriptional regulator with XRE-family HTH domain
MASLVGIINPAILLWARESSGLSASDVANRFKKPVEEIVAWEVGESAPTYIQLERLAYSVYKRPLAVFFFPEPPVEKIRTSFRTLPDFQFDSFDSDTRYAIRHAASRQLALEELCAGKNPAKRAVFKDLQFDISIQPSHVADICREYFKLSLSEQIQVKGAEKAFKFFRGLLEDHGVYVFKRSFKQRDFSGFCLLHEEFPIIYINNTSSFSRQIFTLFHELGHIIYMTSGVTVLDDSYISELSGESRLIETRCNAFAREFLVPSKDFNADAESLNWSVDAIEHLSDKYNVSREVVLRRFLDKGRVSQEFYVSRAKEWNDQFFSARKAKNKSGKTTGNYYSTQISYLGDSYLSLTFSSYMSGRISKHQLSEYLDIKVGNIDRLEQDVIKRIFD